MITALCNLIDSVSEQWQRTKIAVQTDSSLSLYPDLAKLADIHPRTGIEAIV